jgi:hypothetical protein
MINEEQIEAHRLAMKDLSREELEEVIRKSRKHTIDLLMTALELGRRAHVVEHHGGKGLPEPLETAEEYRRSEGEVWCTLREKYADCG